MALRSAGLVGSRISATLAPLRPTSRPQSCMWASRQKDSPTNSSSPAPVMSGTWRPCPVAGDCARPVASLIAVTSLSLIPTPATLQNRRGAAVPPGRPIAFLPYAPRPSPTAPQRDSNVWEFEPLPAVRCGVPMSGVFCPRASAVCPGSGQIWPSCFGPPPPQTGGGGAGFPSGERALKRPPADRDWAAGNRGTESMTTEQLYETYPLAAAGRRFDPQTGADSVNVTYADGTHREANIDTAEGQKLLALFERHRRRTRRNFYTARTRKHLQAITTHRAATRCTGHSRARRSTRRRTSTRVSSRGSPTRLSSDDPPGDRHAGHLEHNFTTRLQTHGRRDLLRVVRGWVWRAA